MPEKKYLSAEVMVNIAEFIAVWWTPIILLAFVIGIPILYVGLSSMAKEGRKGFGLTCIAISGFLFNMTGFLNMMAISFFNERAPDGLRYISNSAEYGVVLTMTIRGVQLFGLFATIRSLLFFKDYAKDQKSELLYTGFGFFLGGIACTNILSLLKFVANVAGGEVEYIINLLT